MPKLPTLASIQTRPARAAVLTLENGRAHTVLPTDRVIFSPELEVLAVGGKAYHVPAYLHEATRRALSVGRIHF